MPFTTDEIQIICRDCGKVRLVKPEVCAQIKGAPDLIALLQSGAIPGCPCGCAKADIQLWLPPDKQPS